MGILMMILAFICLLIFLLCARQIQKDKKIHSALEKAQLVKHGIPVQIVPRSCPEQKGVRTTVPLACGTDKLILTGRGFDSSGVARILTDNGGEGILWETTFEMQRIGLLESAGLEYWGLLSEEYDAPPERESQSPDGA